MSEYTGQSFQPNAETNRLGWYERQELTTSSAIYDRCAWQGAYNLGYRQPNYPMPAIRAFVAWYPDGMINLETPDDDEGYFDILHFYNT